MYDFGQFVSTMELCPDTYHCSARMYICPWCVCVVCHWCSLSLVWSVTGVVCHWCGLSLVQSVTGLVCHWCSLSLEESVISVRMLIAKLTDDRSLKTALDYVLLVVGVDIIWDASTI